MAIAMDSLVKDVCKKFGITLKPKQIEAIQSFVNGNDVFCCLTTGYGKSMCYSLLPCIFDRSKYRDPGTSIVLCISPLVTNDNSVLGQRR